MLPGIVLMAMLTFVPPDTASRPGFLVRFTLPPEGCGDVDGGPDTFSSVEVYDVADSATALSVLPFFEFPATGDTIRWWVEVPGARRVFVKAVDDAGNPACYRSNELDVDGGPVVPVGVVDRQQLRLARVTPMPVRRLAVVEFELAIAGDVALDLYDLAGRQVLELARGPLAAGRHLALLDAGDVAPGLYFLRLTAGDRQVVRRVVVMH